MDSQQRGTEKAQQFAEALAQRRPPRPASWTGAAEARRRARRRNALYIGVTIGLMVLFVVLIGLLMEKTRWSAGSSEQAAAQWRAHDPAEQQGTPAERIDVPTVEYASPPVIESPPPEYRSAPMSAAEMREAKRRADAAMKLIEPHTPEM